LASNASAAFLLTTPEATLLDKFGIAASKSEIIKSTAACPFKTLAGCLKSSPASLNGT